MVGRSFPSPPLFLKLESPHYLIKGDCPFGSIWHMCISYCIRICIVSICGIAIELPVKWSFKDVGSEDSVYKAVARHLSALQHMTGSGRKGRDLGRLDLRPHNAFEQDLLVFIQWNEMIQREFWAESLNADNCDIVDYKSGNDCSRLAFFFSTKNKREWVQPLQRRIIFPQHNSRGVQLFTDEDPSAPCRPACGPLKVPRRSWRFDRLVSVYLQRYNRIIQAPPSTHGENVSFKWFGMIWKRWVGALMKLALMLMMN